MARSQPQGSFVFRVLTRVFLALAALLAMRLLFVAARRMNRVDGGDEGRGTDRAVGGKPGAARVAGGRPRPPINRAAAEDVPYVEVESETARRG